MHTQTFGAGLPAASTNRVSDDTYFASDLGSGSSVITQTNLLRQGRFELQRRVVVRPA